MASSAATPLQRPPVFDVFDDEDDDQDMTSDEKARLDAHLDEVANDPRPSVPAPGWDENGKLFYFNSFDERGNPVLR